MELKGERSRMNDYAECIFKLLVVSEANRLGLVTEESYAQFIKKLLELNVSSIVKEEKKAD